MLKLRNSENIDGIVTRVSLSSVEEMSKFVNFSQDFKVLVNGTETVGRHKPGPYPLILAAERLGVNVEDCVYVGDYYEDLLSVKSAGMASCIVRRSHVPDSLVKHADFSVSNLTELLG